MVGVTHAFIGSFVVSSASTVSNLCCDSERFEIN